MPHFKILARATAVISLFALASTARADQVRSAVSVLTPPTPCSPAYSFDRTIDQSGLSVGYTSGVTDFATYIGANPRHIASNGPRIFPARSTHPEQLTTISGLRSRSSSWPSGSTRSRRPDRSSISRCLRQTMPGSWARRWSDRSRH